jgi:hypothetical protein
VDTLFSLENIYKDFGLMTNWRQTLSWKQVPREPKVGDTIRVIASDILLNMVYIDIVHAGMLMKIIVVDPSVDYDCGSFDYLREQDFKGEIIARVVSFPYSHWKQYFEIVNV